MFTTKEGLYATIKFVFDLIAVLLMFPLFSENGLEYHRVLFIYLIDKLLDLLFHKEKGVNGLFLSFWGIINLWLIIISAAFSFVFMVPAFSSWIEEVGGGWLSSCLMIAVLCELLKSFVDCFIFVVKYKLADKLIKDSLVY